MSRTIFFILILFSALLQEAQRAQAILPQDNRQEEQKRDVQVPAPQPVEKVGSAINRQQFGNLIEMFSEPNGYFDTDNLISNEASYLHVLGKIRQLRFNGGAYIGVGPDQNFSYIAQVRPKIVFIIDIRRDNLLQHLLFKSLFELSHNRLEYLCLLFGKPVPADLQVWDARSIQEIVAYLDKTPASRELFEKTRAALLARVKSFGVRIEPAEFETISRIHTAFYDAGLDLKFTSRNRPPRFYYPSYRDLLLEKDLTGKLGNYLANEEDFRFLKSLEETSRIIPIVGNLAGDHALKNIARYLSERGERVSAIYTSNVEYYLMRGSREDDFTRFAENVKLLPRDDRSVMIRSYFNGSWSYAHPQTVSGYHSTQLLQTIDSFVKEFSAGGYQSYSDLIGKHNLELK
ncbi:MAG: hypothetical protein L0220_14225 [Acidobacteria bacterium]|nr:hypothetical protein [Acidobacteriota bacterium]